MMHVNLENNEYDLQMDCSNDYMDSGGFLNEAIFGSLSPSDASDSTTSDEELLQRVSAEIETNPDFLDIFNHFDGIKDGSPGPTLSPSIFDCSDSAFPNINNAIDPNSLFGEISLQNVKHEICDDASLSSITGMDSEEDWLPNSIINYNTKFPDTPPVTPPQLTPPRDQSPPLSPTTNQISSAKLPASKVITFSQPPPGAYQPVVTVQKQTPLIPKIQPIKYLSISGLVKKQAKSILPKEKCKVRVTQSSVHLYPSTSSPVLPNESSCSADACPIPLIITPPESLDRLRSHPTVAKVNTPSSGNKVTLIAPATHTSMKHTNIDDLRAIKRQQRMIKNRESASLSRKKKKEHLQTLEEENNILRQDNIKLNEKVASLQRENSLLRGMSKQSSRKATTAIYAITFLLTFNLLPLASRQIFNGSERNLFPGDVSTKFSSPISEDVSLDHKINSGGRALLWFDSMSPSNQSVDSAANHSSICPLHMNATESIRIKNELRGWFEPKKPQAKEVKLDLPKKVFHPKSRADRDKVIEEKRVEENNALTSVVPAQSTAYQFMYGSHLHDSYASRSIYMADTSIQRILGSIERRDDTYYVISLSKDHLLVPATESDSSSRPKMSLLLPPNPQAMNQSKDSQQLNLVQIDCEVISTKVVKLQDESTEMLPLAENTRANLTNNDNHRRKKKNLRKNMAIK